MRPAIIIYRIPTFHFSFKYAIVYGMFEATAKTVSLTCVRINVRPQRQHVSHRIVELSLSLQYFIYGNFCAGQGPSVYTIDIGDGQMPSNYLNAGYSISETGSKPSHPNDGLPSYEEAVGKTVPLAVAPLAPAATSSAPTQPTHPTVEASEVNETGRGHRHRRHRRHRHHNEEIENDDQQPHDDRRRHRRRGFRLRRHLAKMGRNQSNQQ